MFYLQPGNGLGLTGSREMALGLGGSFIVAVIETGGVWIAHASGILWNARPVATAWQAVCSVVNWKADDC